MIVNTNNMDRNIKIMRDFDSFLFIHILRPASLNKLLHIVLLAYKSKLR